MPLAFYEEFYRIIKELNDRGIAYAVIGGVAVSLHTTPRFTRDIDILLCAKDLAALTAAMDSVGYKQWATPWTFRNTNLTLHRFLKFAGEDMLMVDILVGDKPFCEAMIARAVIRDTPDGHVRLACKADIITLKLGRNSDIDRADIKALQNENDPASDSRSQRPLGLRPADGLAAQNPPVSGSAPRRRPVAKKPKKAPRRRPKK